MGKRTRVLQFAHGKSRFGLHSIIKWLWNVEIFDQTVIGYRTGYNLAISILIDIWWMQFTYTYKFTFVWASL